MKEIKDLPPGIEIYSNIISYPEAEFLIDNLESSINSDSECEISWGIPQLHSPDITCLRGDKAVALSDHAFKNINCDCGIKQIESMLGKVMLKCLEKYATKYGIGFTFDEGFVAIKQEEEHIPETGIDDNPFVNRILSMHFPLNPNSSKEYLKFPNIDYSISLSSPSIIMFPSNFLFAYQKPYQEGLYEIENFFNDNPSQEYYEQVFGEQER